MLYNKDSSLYYIWLTNLSGVGKIKAHRLLSEYGSAKNIFEADLPLDKDLSRAKKIFEECERKNIMLIDYESPVYPAAVKELSDQPVLLYARGRIPENYENCLTPDKCAAIIGPRRCSIFVRDMAVDIGKDLIDAGKTIVSGMAMGVDSYAHTAAIKNGGYTIAVLGYGLDHCFPSSHLALKEKIAENGLLITEYEPDTPPRKFNFPVRNRIIAAWSGEINVVGVTGKSGTRTTVAAGLEYGRTVNVIG